MSLIKSIFFEYGVPWCLFKGLYSIKLKMLSIAPSTEKLFEKKVSVQRVNLFTFDTKGLRHFLLCLDETAKRELIDTADAAIQGKIKGFSSQLLDYGMPLNWQVNPLTGQSCDQKSKWYRIPDFDSQRGDIKVVWEASRFSHFFLFARAYLLSNDKKYYRAFAAQLAAWLEENPYAYGANFKCGQECALRMLSALMVYGIFSDCNCIDKQVDLNIRTLVSRCYQKVLSNFFYAYRCIKNNHTLSELAGMIAGAWCCGDQKKLERAYTLFDQVSNDQLTADGGYIQFSFNYQRLALQIFECVSKMSERTKRSVSQDMKKKWESAAHLMFQCQNADGDLPNYGSNDGALLFPVTSCGYRDFRASINAVYALTAGTRLYSPGDYDEELYWFGQGMVPVVTKELHSCAFPQAGIFTLRKAKSFLFLVLNDFHSRPAHMDQLHLDLWVNGVNVLCDSGTYSYSSKKGADLVATCGHNTLYVAGMEQMNKHGPFLIYDWTKRQGLQWDAEHFDGKICSKNGYSHRRAVASTSYGWRLTDTIEAPLGTPYVLLLHTPCDVEIIGGTATFFWNKESICSLAIDGPIHVDKTIRSLFYLQAEDINCLTVSGIVSNTVETVTMELHLNKDAMKQ